MDELLDKFSLKKGIFIKHGEEAADYLLKLVVAFSVIKEKIKF